MPLKKLSIICSFLFMAGCSGIELPAADLCVADSQNFRMICYNLKNDYTVVGNRVVLRGTAKPHYKPFNKTLDADRFTCTDPQSFAAIKAWAQALADKYQNTTCN